MSYLLDTCVVSELARAEPEAAVAAWVERQNETDLFISVLVLGELEKGISKLPESSKKNRLQAWLYTDMCERFRGRILEITPEIALEWGRASGLAAADGRTIPAIDGLLGASAIVHSLVVVTRNTEDISPTGAPVLNPWEDGQ
jgi:predicted nucleic acid-binding protein